MLLLVLFNIGVLSGYGKLCYIHTPTSPMVAVFLIFFFYYYYFVICWRKVGFFMGETIYKVYPARDHRIWFISTLVSKCTV